MYALEFENRMTVLLPGLDIEAMKSLLSYAAELDRDSVCPQSEFFKKAYAEFSLIKQHYGHELANRLFNMATVFTFNPHEISGCAELLNNGMEAGEIEKMALDGLCDLCDSPEQLQEHETVMADTPDAQMYKDKPWFSDLCQLLEKGYCTPQKDNLHSIFEACGKLKFTASYRDYFNCDYIISCREYDKYSLKRIYCLLHFLETAKAELKEYSESWDWKAPKPGFLKEWADAAFRYERVQQMIGEIHHRHNDFEDTVKIYIGTINGWSTGMTHTDDPHQYVERVEFGVSYTGNSYSSLDDSVVLHVAHDIGISWLINGYYDVERHKRYDEGKSTVLRAYVDSINYIKKFEWVEA